MLGGSITPPFVDSFNDVWKSENSIIWENILPDTGSPGPNQFEKRVAHTAVVLGDSIYLIGGGALEEMIVSEKFRQGGSRWPIAFPGRSIIFIEN